jgi:hypothetical protein
LFGDPSVKAMKDRARLGLPWYCVLISVIKANHFHLFGSNRICTFPF